MDYDCMIQLRNRSYVMRELACFMRLRLAFELIFKKKDMPVSAFHVVIAFFTFTFLLCCQPRKTPVLSDQVKYAVGDNSRSSLDWSGSYKGFLPCADCSGIEVVISLYTDHSYRLRRRYAGKEDMIREEKGLFEWDRQGRSITLARDGGKYLVGENRLFQLDEDGRRITGALADNYILDKIEADITERYWKLTELAGQDLKNNDADREAYIILKEGSGKVIGAGNCNAISGEFETDSPNRIRFTSLARTYMACQTIQTEEAFLQVLQIADSYHLDNDTLQLFKGRMAPLARFEAVYLR